MIGGHQINGSVFRENVTDIGFSRALCFARVRNKLIAALAEISRFVLAVEYNFVGGITVAVHVSHRIIFLEHNAFVDVEVTGNVCNGKTVLAYSIADEIAAFQIGAGSDMVRRSVRIGIPAAVTAIVVLVADAVHAVIAEHGGTSVSFSVIIIVSHFSVFRKFSDVFLVLAVKKTSLEPYPDIWYTIK